MLIHIIILLLVCVNYTDAQVPHIFTTQRTRAEKTTIDHVDYLREIITDPKVQDAYNSTDEATFTNVEAQLSLINDQWERYGYGLYTIFDKETSAFIGFAGYYTVPIDELGTINILRGDGSADELELYFLFMPSYWRCGYGSEVAIELINIAFKYLPYSSVIARIEPKNYPSLQFIKKLNFIEESMGMYNNKPHLLYRLSKSAL